MARSAMWHWKRGAKANRDMTWRVQVPLEALMTGTPSRTATVPAARGIGRKLYAKSRPEVHEEHTRRQLVGEEA
jgi:hypothetical protein